MRQRHYGQPRNLRTLRFQLHRAGDLSESVHQYRNGDLVGKICAQTGKGVREVVLERGLLSEEELNRILSPRT